MTENNDSNGTSFNDDPSPGTLEEYLNDYRGNGPDDGVNIEVLLPLDWEFIQHKVYQRDDGDCIFCDELANRVNQRGGRRFIDFRNPPEEDSEIDSLFTVENLRTVCYEHADDRYSRRDMARLEYKEENPGERPDHDTDALPGYSDTAWYSSDESETIDLADDDAATGADTDNSTASDTGHSSTFTADDAATGSTDANSTDRGGTRGDGRSASSREDTSATPGENQSNGDGDASMRADEPSDGDDITVEFGSGVQTGTPESPGAGHENKDEESVNDTDDEGADASTGNDGIVSTLLDGFGAADLSVASPSLSGPSWTSRFTVWKLDTQTRWEMYAKEADTEIGREHTDSRTAFTPEYLLTYIYKLIPATIAVAVSVLLVAVSAAVIQQSVDAGVSVLQGAFEVTSGAMGTATSSSMSILAALLTVYIPGLYLRDYKMDYPRGRTTDSLDSDISYRGQWLGSMVGLGSGSAAVLGGELLAPGATVEAVVLGAGFLLYVACSVVAIATVADCLVTDCKNRSAFSPATWDGLVRVSVVFGVTAPFLGLSFVGTAVCLAAPITVLAGFYARSLWFSNTVGFTHG